MIAITPIQSSVLAALRACGRRNAVTPFEIASTPVNALHPEANARNRTIAPTPPARPTCVGSGTCAVGHPVISPRIRPITTSAPIESMKP